ncbi:MAG: hypothetical protein K6F61_06440 [Clostridiales bacterium]|nr:hypothetical protein [Clostridiales bacterium]
MITTLHSIERAKERTGMNPRAAEHFMRNALERGRDKSMFACEQKRRWLAAKENACGFKALVYNDICLIVNREVVITMYEVPDWFKRSARYNGKERIRNRARFEKFNRSGAEAGWVM